MTEDHPFIAQAVMNGDWRVVVAENKFEDAHRAALRSARLPVRIVHRGETVWEKWASNGEMYAPGFVKFKDVAA
jgi:hypothetical protein